MHKPGATTHTTPVDLLDSHVDMLKSFTGEGKTRRKPGRKPLAQSERVEAERRPIRLQTTHWHNLEQLAVDLDIRATSGPKIGSHSWRALIRFLAQNTNLILQGIRLCLSLGPEKVQAVLSGEYVLVEKANNLTVEDVAAFQPEAA